MTIVRVNEFTAAAGKTEELYAFLKSLLPYITDAPGCLSCELFKHNEQQDQFMVIEKWDKIESHQLAITQFPKEEMQAAMSLFGAPPKGNYYHGSE